MTARLVVLASGTGSNLQAVIDGCAAGRIPGRVVQVVVNRRDARAAERAAAAGIPAAYRPLGPYRAAGRSRRDYDADLADVVASAEPDWVVLAGWMHILSSAFLDRFPGRVLNLHPALPGAFPGAHAVADALAAWQRGEADGTGVMVHLVPDERVDEGPVLASEAVAIHPGDTLASLTERIHAVESRLLVDTLTRLCAGEQLAATTPDRTDHHPLGGQP